MDTMQTALASARRNACRMALVHNGNDGPGEVWVLAAVEAGESPGAAARRFAVGRSTAYRWAAAARDEGRRTAKPMDGGPKPVITAAAEWALRRMLQDKSHLTLAECRDRLAAETGLRVHPWTVGRALRRMGWT
jgi:transposase